MKQTWLLLTMVTILSASIYLFFKAFHFIDMPEFAKELLAGFLGAVITVIITAILLRSQSVNEIQRERSVGVFQAKLVAYTEFCMFLNGVLRDGRLADNGMHELRSWALRIELISGRHVSECIEQFFLQIHRYKKVLYSDLTQIERQDFDEWIKNSHHIPLHADPKMNFISIGSLMSFLKKDLGESEISRKLDVASTRSAIDDIISDELKIKS